MKNCGAVKALLGSFSCLLTYPAISNSDNPSVSYRLSLRKSCFQVFKSLDKSEFFNMLSGDRKSSSVQRAKKSEVPKIEQKVKDEDSGTW